jgi:methionyl-tRNA synthetase
MQDVLRYVLTATCPETKDNDFTWKEFQTRNNSELVSIYGNFTNRVLSLIDKYYDGNIPKSNSLDITDQEVLNEVINFKNQLMISLDNFKFREALKGLMNIARLGNKYLADNEPWKIKNDNPTRVEEILNVSFIIVSYLAVISEPFIPFTSKKLKDMIGLKKVHWKDLDNLKDHIDFDFKINNKEMLFRRIEDSEIEFQKSKLNKGIN